MLLHAKIWGQDHGTGQKIGIFNFSRDRPAMRHGRQTGHCEAGTLGGRKTEGAAYLMPDWVGRMASSLIK